MLCLKHYDRLSDEADDAPCYMCKLAAAEEDKARLIEAARIALVFVGRLTRMDDSGTYDDAERRPVIETLRAAIDGAREK